jgi:hypothetical protein
MTRRGRILATKWGLNPNSSSLGVDVTFLLVGATAVAMATPIVGALLRWRRPAPAVASVEASVPPEASEPRASSEPAEPR